MRVVFCMFADDTGVFEPRDIFLDFIETRTGEDGADLGPWLAQLFEVLDTPEDERAATLDEDLARFPYVNGDLFKGHLRTFSFDSGMRWALLDACRFDWSNISPAIFGALFQSVMDPGERRAQGAHYTTEKNILKVIEPLFMDDLRAELKRVRMRRGRDRPGGAPAVPGETPRSDVLRPGVRMRQLSHHCLPGTADARNRGDPRNRGRGTGARYRVGGGLGGRGPVLRNRAWGVPGSHRGDRAVDDDHIMNSRLSLEFGQTFVRIPLDKSPHIVHGDSLETNWSGLLPPANAPSCWAILPSWARNSRRRSNAVRCARSRRSVRVAERSITSPRGSSRRVST